MEKTAKLEVEQTHQGTRLDVYINEQIPDLSRSKAKELINENQVTVNGDFIKASYKVLAGDEITVEIDEQMKAPDIIPQNIPVDIIYEDKDLLIVNKARGMVVHPGAGNWQDTLVNALLYHCQQLSPGSSEERPGIVHRLDKDTSGLMVVAKNDKAHRKLSRDIKYRLVKRTYLALARGNFPKDKATIDLPIGRNPYNRKQMAVVKSGKEAVTRVKVLRRFNNLESVTLLRCQLETGRTHQIRVHLTRLGHPILGDKIYGSGKSNLDEELSGQLLHSFELQLCHPQTGEQMNFRAPLPGDMYQTIKKLK